MGEPLLPAIVDARAAIALISPRIKPECLPICFDGETGWLICGRQRDHAICSVRLVEEETEREFIARLYGSRQWLGVALPLVKPTPEESQWKARQVKELARASVVEGVEWWQLEGAGSGVCAAVLRLCSGCEFTLAAPLTSDLPREAFLAAARAWFDHHGEYGR